GPICAREAQKGLPGNLFVALGLDAPFDVPGAIRASAGVFPVDPAAMKAGDLKKFADLGRGAPTWWAGLGHDAGLLAWAAVKQLPKTRAADADAIAARSKAVIGYLAAAAGDLWTTEAKGFAGARTMRRAVSVTSP